MGKKSKKSKAQRSGKEVSANASVPLKEVEEGKSATPTEEDLETNVVTADLNTNPGSEISCTKSEESEIQRVLGGAGDNVTTSSFLRDGSEDAVEVHPTPNTSDNEIGSYEGGYSNGNRISDWLKETADASTRTDFTTSSVLAECAITDAIVDTCDDRMEEVGLSLINPEPTFTANGRQKPTTLSLSGISSVPNQLNLISPNSCPHMVKSVSTSGLRKAFKTDVKPYCHPCSYKAKATESLLSTVDQSWICLQCGHIACGDFNAQNGDAVKHFNTPTSDLHSIVVQLGEEYRCWCFLCQSEVNSKNAHVKESVLFVKKKVKGKLSSDLACHNKKLEQEKSDQAITVIPMSLPAPPPFPAGPNIYKQYNGKKDSSGKLIKCQQSALSSECGSDKRPLGLENLGNTCFMNAALQCLSRTKVLIPKLDLFGSGENITVLVSLVDDKANISVQNTSEWHGDSTKTENLTETYTETDLTRPFLINLDISSESMTAKLKHTFKAITRHTDLQSGVESYSSREFNSKHGGKYYGFRPYDVHNKIAKNFRPGAQHDSHELLRTVVDMMKKDQTKAFRAGIMKKFGVAKGGEGSDPKMVEFVKSLDQKVKHQTFVDEIFGGELMTTQTCLTCKSIKRSHEEFLDISLPIRVSKGNKTEKNTKSTSFSNPAFQDYSENENIVINRTVEECLSAFTEPELLTGSNLVECENCHRINLARVQNGATFEDVFPCATQFSPSANAQGGVGQHQKGGKSKVQDERKKRRPSRQSRRRNQISRHESNEQSVSGDIDIAGATMCSSISMVENHFNSRETSEGEASRSTIDDYVVVSHTDIPSPVNLGKQKFTDMDEVEDCDDIPALISDSETDHDQCPAPVQALLADNDMAMLKSDGDCDADGDIDSDLPSAADGIGGSASECEDNGVPSLDIDLPDYDKFNVFYGPSGSTTTTATTTAIDLDTQKTAADEGYSEGDNSAENDSAVAAGTIVGAPVIQLLSQGSSSRNSISDPEESSKGGSGNELMIEKSDTKKEPPITKCPCSRQQAISRPPEFLTIHLKRFQISNRGFTSKLSDHIEFPLLLDLTRFCAVVSEESKNEIFDEDGQVMYNLYGIVEHSGSLHWGHYVAYIRVPAYRDGESQMEKDTWYYISDSHVNTCTEDSIAYRDPYILFYERVRGDSKRELERVAVKKQGPQAHGEYFSSTNSTTGWASTSYAASNYTVLQKWGENWEDDQPVKEYGPVIADAESDRKVEKPDEIGFL